MDLDVELDRSPAFEFDSVVLTCHAELPTGMERKPTVSGMLSLTFAWWRRSRDPARSQFWSQMDG